MRTEEMIEKYRIRMKDGKIEINGKVSKKEIDEIRKMKSEIISYLKEKKIQEEKKIDELRKKVEDPGEVRYRRKIEDETVWIDEPIQQKSAVWEKKIVAYLPEPHIEWKEGAGYFEMKDGYIVDEDTFRRILERSGKNEISNQEAYDLVSEYIDEIRKRENTEIENERRVFDDDELESGYRAACENAGVPKVMR